MGKWALWPAPIDWSSFYVSPKVFQGRLGPTVVHLPNVRLHEGLSVKADFCIGFISSSRFFMGVVLGGFCQGVQVSCEDRINFYPAAPIRLATMHPARRP